MTTRAGRGRLPAALWPALVGGAFFGPVMQVSEVLLFGEVWRWAEVAVRSALYTVGVALFAAVALRVSATARDQADVGRAVSTGVLPQDADGEWQGRLTAERRRLQANRTAVPGLAGLAAVLVAVVTLLPAGPGGAGWLLAAGLALAGGLLAVRERSRLRTVERMLGELAASEGESAHVGDRPPSA
ncbi:hypothetical protein [Geodermatophilus sp. SYSU D01176]